MLDLRGDVFISVEINGLQMRFYAHSRHSSFEKTKKDVTPKQKLSKKVRAEILAFKGYDHPKSKEYQAFLDICYQNYGKSSDVR